MDKHTTVTGPRAINMAVAVNKHDGMANMTLLLPMTAIMTFGMGYMSVLGSRVT